MNLINDPWIPVRRASNTEELIAPSQITDRNDPVLVLAAPRPDFNGALLQFLIGLLQTACPPETEEAWSEWLKEPPTPEKLQEKFVPLEDAFNLSGDRPLFMQDFDPLKGEEKPIANLLIDAPGAQTLRQNADHFIKRGGMERLCPGCAATALFNLQINAPSGGAGHRTSLRGGGPLTTLVALDPAGSGLDATLWRACWLNVLERKVVESCGTGRAASRETIFPWLGPTRTSEPKTGCETTPLDVHPLQMYWGMPRRIRIKWDNGTKGQCDLCGREVGGLIKRYVTQTYGTNYTGAWVHPLSPYVVNKDGELLPQHPQPGGLNYGHWLGLVTQQEGRQPARVVTAFVVRRRLPEEQLRLRSFGYDMDKMKARCWYEATFPLYQLGRSILQSFTYRTGQLIEAATSTAQETRWRIKDAWFKRPGDARGDTAFLVEEFFSRTENAFYDHLQQLEQRLKEGEDETAILEKWHGQLKMAALDLFDYWTSRGDFEAVDPRRIVRAYRKLEKWLYGKKLRTDILGLPQRKRKTA